MTKYLLSFKCGLNIFDRNNQVIEIHHPQSLDSNN